MQTKQVVTTDANQGQKFMMAGGEYRIIISGKQTGGTFAVIEMSVPPGAGPNPHSHPNFEESFYVLEGEISFKSEAGSYLAEEKSFINIPKGGIVHGFKNLTAHPAKLLCTVIPAGLDDFFLEASGFMKTAKEAAYPEAEIKRNLELISEKFGQKIYGKDFLG